MSIEAMNWARRIHVGDAYGKSVLRAIADYADENGHCFPSLARLATDCDLSVDSVRRRIKLLEEGGLIVTFRSWMDESGKRNSEGRGRETSRDIRLLLEVVRTREMVEVEAVAGGDGADSRDDETADTPLANSKGGLAASEGRGSSAARGGVALQPPLEPSLNDHLKDSPPNPPQNAGGVSGTEDLQGEAKELWDGFRADYPDSATFVWQKARPAFAALTVVEQRHVRSAAAQYARTVAVAKRKPAIVQPRTFIRDRMFENFQAAGIASGRFDEASEAARALEVLHLVAGASEYFHSYVRRPGGVFYRKAVTPQLLALAKAPPRDAWVQLTRQQAAAWEHLLREAVTVQVRNHLGEGSLAPWLWPPSVEGKLYDAAAPPSAPELSDDDAQALADERMR